MATPNKELSEKLASRQSRIEADPWLATAAPQLLSPRSTTVTVRLAGSEPAAAPSAAASAAGAASPDWVAALPILKIEWYQPGWLSALRSWNTAAVAAAEGHGETVSATTAAAFGLPAASVVVLNGVGDKQATVVGLAAESTYRMRVVPGRLLVTSIARAAFEAGQGRLRAGEELPKLAAGTEYAVVWGAPSAESEPLATLSVEAEREADRRAALAKAAEEAAEAERQAKIAATKGESGTYSKETFQARTSIFKSIEAASPAAPSRGRPSVGGVQASARGHSAAAASAASAPASPSSAIAAAAAAPEAAVVDAPAVDAPAIADSATAGAAAPANHDAAAAPDTSSTSE